MDAAINKSEYWEMAEPSLLDEDDAPKGKGQRVLRSLVAVVFLVLGVLSMALTMTSNGVTVFKEERPSPGVVITYDVEELGDA